MAQHYDRGAEDLGNITMLEHVNLQIPSQAQATLFYIQGLGLTRDPYMNTGLANMWINVGKSQFHLPTGGTPDHHNFSEKIAPGQKKSVAFGGHPYQRVLPGSFGASEPVTVRALVYFDSPSGQFHQV